MVWTFQKALKTRKGTGNNSKDIETPSIETIDLRDSE